MKKDSSGTFLKSEKKEKNYKDCERTHRRRSDEKGMSIQADISPFPIPNVAMIWVQLSNVPMGKVHPRDVHPILNEFEEGGGLPRNWTNGANNSGEPHLVCGAVHVQVRHKLHLKFV